MSIEVEIVGGVSELDAMEWDALTDGSPILSHAFLSALEDTGCLGAGTGWQPYPITVRNHGKLVGATALYLKTHSYGEYVFDWAWADAYERNGMAYYPKLLAAIPFTPITGPRLLSADTGIQALMAQVLIEQMERHSLSSSHILFPDEATANILRQAGWLERKGVQFRWQNEGFKDFEDFLSRLSHDKRKKIKQERKKITAAGVTCRKLTAENITQADWDFFFSCYQNTYREHRSTPYLTREFFYALGERLPLQTLLIVAEQNGQPIASALNLFDSTNLYGRYWGALEYVLGLHFELCYYQAQEFCIARNIRYFEGGAQGEHKLARGFLPRPTCSFHKIAHPDFEAAIRNFVGQEAENMGAYHNELEERAPFKVS
ncbi:MAG TPA: GNAT family N-acetyltransferase [Methylophilaceae bacterium]